MKFTKIIILLFATFSLSAQSPSLIWQKAIGGSLYDKAEQVINTFDGGFIIIGSSQSSNFDVGSNRGGYDFFCVKIDFQGNIEWKKSLGSNADDNFYSIIQRADSSYIACGQSISSTFDFQGNYGHTDIWLVKLSKNGNVVWKRNYGGSLNDYARKIINTTDGGFAVVGTTESSDHDVVNSISFLDAWVLKFDNTEQLQWTRCLGGGSNEYGFSVKETSDGGFVICGNTTSYLTGANNYGMMDGFVAKLNSSGNILWQKTYGGTDNDHFRTVLITSNGNIVAAGETYSGDFDAVNNHYEGNRDYLVVYMNANGEKIWSNCYGGSNNDYSREVINSTDGNLVLSGETYSNDGNSTYTHGSSDYWIFKLNHSGQILWQKSYGGAEHDEPNCIIQTPDNGFLVVGNSASLNNGDVSGVHGDDDFWIVRLANQENCFNSLNLTQNNITESANFNTSAEIKSNVKIIAPNKPISYFSGGKIILTPGFETKTNAVFKAEISGCQ